MDDKQKLNDLIAKFPTPAARDGKLAEIDKEATDAAVKELLKGGQPTMVALIDCLVPAAKGGDSQARHAVHALVIHVGGSKDPASRQVVAHALAATLGGERPKEIQVFVLQQLQLIGDKEVSAAVGKFLLDAELGEPAAQTLLAIKSGASEAFREALPKATGRQRTSIAHGLGTLRDAGSVDELKKLLDAKESDTRLMAAWALANIGDGGSATLLMKMAEAADGFDRIKATQSCLLLAERLLAAGKKADAANIYTHLHQTRTDPSERHVKEAAARGLAATK